MDGSIRPFAYDDLEPLAILAQRLNAQRETGSTFCCIKAVDIRRDFEETMAYGSACWSEDGKPLGLISCFPDWEKGNADCSLLLDAHGASYLEMAAALVSAARERLGPKVACTFFFPMENRDCRRFLDLAGAQRQVNEYLLFLGREDWNAPANLAAEPRPLQDEERDAFAALHNKVFPDAYASGQDILTDLGKARFVYAVPDRAGLAAYGVLKTSGGGHATVEMVGVRKDARQRGYGRAVLNHLASRAFSEFGADRLDLVVDADNRNALALYLDTGFRVHQENNCYILR